LGLYVIAVGTALLVRYDSRSSSCTTCGTGSLSHGVGWQFDP
jgi:hypothetical protein